MRFAAGTGEVMHQQHGKRKVHIRARQAGKNPGMCGGFNYEQGLVLQNIKYRVEPAAASYSVAQRVRQVAHFRVGGA